MPRNRYETAQLMLDDLRDPSRVQPFQRAQRLKPRSLAWVRARRIIAVVFFFGSLVGIFIFLVWLANRYPTPPAAPRKSYRGQVR